MYSRGIGSGRVHLFHARLYRGTERGGAGAAGLPSLVWLGAGAGWAWKMLLCGFSLVMMSGLSGCVAMSLEGSSDDGPDRESGLDV